MCRRDLALAVSGLVVLAVQLPAAISLAETDTAVGATDTKNDLADPAKAEASVLPVVEPPEKPAAPAKPAAATCNRCPSHSPLYVEDWGRLVALTRSEKAEFWRNRQETSRWVLGTGLFLGGGAAALGTLDRLTTDGWTTASKWSVTAGVGVAVVSVLSYWAFAPDRDDLLTVINHWNIRHPDMLLAP
jgi:hypothetical protein